MATSDRAETPDAPAPKPPEQAEPVGTHTEELLDEALAETFPASDPVSISSDTR